MTDETDRAWRTEFAHRYVARMLLRPPWPPPPVYVRPTDEEIDALPEEMRRYARIRRDVLDSFSALSRQLNESLSRQLNEARTRRETGQS